MTIELIKNFIRSQDVCNIIVVLYFHACGDDYTSIYYAYRRDYETDEMVKEDINRVNEYGMSIGNEERIRKINIKNTRILKYEREEKIKSFYDI